MCSISLCMIVKNEEKNIKRCLDSVKEFVNEIIIVDTGAKDATIEICKEYNTKIYQYDWQEDYNNARNNCLDKATSRWILWMDADEELVVSDRKGLNKLLEGDTAPYLIKVIHFFDKDFLEMKQTFVSYHTRLFPNDKSCKFVGKVNEKLIRTNMEMESEKAQIFDGLSFKHYGFGKEVTIEQVIGNLNVLTKENEIEQENPWTLYYIGAELYNLDDLVGAFTYVNKALSMFAGQKKLPPAVVYKLKYEILLITENTKTALKGIEKVIELYPDYVEFQFLRGIICFLEGQLEESIKSFSYCLVLGEYNPNYMIQCGKGSFMAYYYMGQCYEKLGELVYAEKAYEQSLCTNRLYAPALERLKILKNLNNKISNAYEGMRIPMSNQ